jgi:hypothetical protein
MFAARIAHRYPTLAYTEDNAGDAVRANLFG